MNVFAKFARILELTVSMRTYSSALEGGGVFVDYADTHVRLKSRTGCQTMDGMTYRDSLQAKLTWWSQARQ
jgi:hypothetical protein